LIEPVGLAPRNSAFDRQQSLACSDWWEIGALKPHELPVAAKSPHVFYGISLQEVTGRMAAAVE
jgi:nitroimidazol reductase NimA-like FMN-containing flavoprotein (pyridoxamine 5'-phosphate oxidase superfamily)